MNIETLSQKEIDNKIIYIENMKMLENNKKITELEKEIDNLILEYLQYEKIRILLGELRKIYHNRIEEIKKETTSDIRVPLLIYTAKILQDYQDGLGVFIDDRDYRFKSSGYKKADILNTFSSGQLSGFSLAFLLTMNRVYSNSSNLNILLIDDPVQTLDDINLSSFVEVLRNEFKNKQIILSTHELEKEYYMLYKFFRNGLKGESYNIKNRLY